MNAKVLEAVNNLREVLSKEMNFHPQTIALLSYDHYKETSDPNIALDLTVKHGFKSHEFRAGRFAAKLDYGIEDTNVLVEMRHYFDKAEEYTEDDLPKEYNCDNCQEEKVDIPGDVCEECYEEWLKENKLQKAEYRESKI